MNTIKWVVLLICLFTLAGCASGRPQVTGTEGSIEPVSSLEQIRPADLASRDIDGDGILDSEDSCKDSTPKALVDELGCEIVMGVIEGLKFDPNGAELSVNSRVVLSKIVDVLLRYPNVVVTIGAHTDNRGTAADNLELSKQRVLSVVRYMVFNGIAADRIKPFAFGEGMPLAANATPEGREQNRRIEINVVEGLL